MEFERKIFKLLRAYKEKIFEFAYLLIVAVYLEYPKKNINTDPESKIKG